MTTKASSEHFTTSDGAKLHYLDQGTGPPIVLLPGWTQPASGFAAQSRACLPAFAAWRSTFAATGSQSGRLTAIGCRGSRGTALTFLITSA